MNELLMGLACSYGPDVFRRFLGSLRDSGFAGDIVLFLLPGDASAELQEVFAHHQAQAVFFDHAPYHLQTFRYALYEEFLRQSAKHYAEARIFICDVRDIIFQKNLFDYPLAKEVELTFFAEERIIADCPHNTKWLMVGFGEELYQSIKENPILCSGTTLGSSVALLQYLRTLNALAREIMPRAADAACGMDQGIHNAIYYQGLLHPHRIQVLGNEDALVNTLNYGFKQVNEDGQVVTRKGELCCVAHQIDRLPFEALNIMLKKLPYPLEDIYEKRLFIEGNILFNQEMTKLEQSAEGDK